VISGPVNFPGQDPEQGKADSASGPLITPVPRETTPSTAVGYGEERDELPDMSALDIRPVGTEDLGKPAEQVLGKGKQALLPNQDAWLKTDEARRLSEFRDQRQKSGQSTPPYGPVWQNLKPNKGGASRSHNGFRFEWDRQHGGEIEVFDDKIHIGVIDPVTGNWLKPGDSDKNGKKRN